MLFDFGECKDKVGVSFKAFPEMLKVSLKRLGKESSRAAVLYTPDPYCLVEFRVKALEIPS